MTISEVLTTIAQWAGIAMPTIYAGITFQYSLTMSLLSSTASSPNSPLLARQWLALYQQGPRWVPPLVQTGLLANLYLAFFVSPNTPQSSAVVETTWLEVLGVSAATVVRVLYLAAGVLTISILPFTLLHLEPGINGACKWKVAALLGDATAAKHQPFTPELSGVGRGVRRHTASEASKRWAESRDMVELVEEWARRNHLRWVVGVVAGAVSFAGLVLRG
ncbi:uncharacterized protein C8A04DRAFT_12462 [Dichotomopilus funicola]|uniref:DUF1772-domain-containing protein n=1 Tax=Dichotomopilus funicola TaxID=1934379 RepID=A0AAN6V1U8_9PEZI|nr:hypothetical protein C8A04DRAFT_12462 [Dichotomopilus funicola]